MKPFRLTALDSAWLRSEFENVAMTMEIPIASLDWTETSHDHLGNPFIRAFGSNTVGADQFALEVRFEPVLDDGKVVPGKWTWRAEAEVRDDLGQPKSILRLSSQIDEVVEYMKVASRE